MYFLWVHAMIRKADDQLNYESFTEIMDQRLPIKEFNLLPVLLI